MFKDIAPVHRRWPLPLSRAGEHPDEERLTAATGRSLQEDSKVAAAPPILFEVHKFPNILLGRLERKADFVAGRPATSLTLVVKKE
jgi:hypothetical protein